MIAVPGRDPLTAELTRLARAIRVESISAIYAAGSGHPGGALSCADLLAYLFAVELKNLGPTGTAPDRDRFVLSKGHACPALYAVAGEMGWIPRASLTSLRKLGAPLQGHPCVTATPWANASTGSLGQGFSVALGMAWGLRLQERVPRVYAMLGDGELQEGEVWEAAMAAAHHRLTNLCAIVDYNKMQSDDVNARVMNLEPLRPKWEAFGWHAVELDGHDFSQIAEALAEARRVGNRPTVLIAHTVKGRGVSFMEGSPAWHGSVRIKTDEFRRALADLGVPGAEIERRRDASGRRD
jgi:transketolase